MGKLIGIQSESGPANKLVYEGVDESQRCFIDCECGARIEMICICGAQIEIESFRHSWSIIETRVRWERHLEDAHKPA
ncbi:MAG: hypothetical protein NT032_03865 [Actinobacteria bacterium]|nr:hypothetical protein [Actinomycetota bacterium]